MLGSIFWKEDELLMHPTQIDQQFQETDKIRKAITSRKHVLRTIKNLFLEIDLGWARSQKEIDLNEMLGRLN